jgi:hypothetical protein
MYSSGDEIFFATFAETSLASPDPNLICFAKLGTRLSLVGTHKGFKGFEPFNHVFWGL